MEKKICEIHNQPALFREKDAQQKLFLLCRYCIEEQQLNIQNFDDGENIQKQALKQLQLKFDQSIKLLKDFADKLEQYTYLIQKQLNKFKDQVEQNIEQMIDKKNEVKKISNDFTTLQLNQINKEESIIYDWFTQIWQLLNNEFEELEISSRLYELYKSFNNLSIDVNIEEQQQVQIEKITEFNKKFDYQLMQQSSYQQNEMCGAIAFNKDGTIMIAGCDKFIKVFEFTNDKLREVQKLNEHSNNIFCLQFMKKSIQFISASEDSTIIIWKLNQNNLWVSDQVLKEHTSCIYCITMNLSEDILISGSSDTTIKFWQKQNNIWSSNQSIDCQNSVHSIDLNDQEDQLIASVYDKILIFQLYFKEWLIKQKISVEQSGYRLCYINQDQFVFQPFQRQNLLIFDNDLKDQIYNIGQELQYMNQACDGFTLFPIHYIPQIGLIMVKNDHHVHLIKRSQNSQFIVEQSINFSTEELFGCITDDGKFIATWDSKSNEIQIRKFQY